MKFTSRLLLAAFAAAAFVMADASVSSASVAASADPDYPAGSEVFTVDPDGRGISGSAGRGLANTRMLRQSFQNPVTFDVRGIILSQDVDNGDFGYEMSFYEVDDVNAETFTPGNLIKTISIPAGAGSIPTNSENRLGFSLFGSDIFTLPARGDIGSGDVTGYAIELSNNDPLEAGNVGNIRHTNFTDPDTMVDMDFYPAGKFYTESGGQSGRGHRDIGLALFSDPLTIPEPASLVLFSLAGSLMALKRQR